MGEFAEKGNPGAVLGPSACPSVETLAALIDGRLARKARREALNHLEHCRQCYAVFSESLRFVVEEEGRTELLEPAKPKSFWKSFSFEGGAPRRIWAFSASLALLFVATAVIYNLVLERQTSTWNRAGLALYQSGMKQLATRDGPAVIRFKWPQPVEAQTLETRGILRGGDWDELPEDLALAAERFERAMRKNPGDKAIHLNLISSLLPWNEAAAAANAEKAFQRFPEDPGIRAAQALALFAWGRKQNHAETRNRAIGIMESLHEAHPDSAEAAYNLGRMYWETGQSERARLIWRVFLEREPEGPHAALVRELLK